MSNPTQIASFASVLAAAPTEKEGAQMRLRKRDQRLQQIRDEMLEEGRVEGYHAGYDDGYQFGVKNGRQAGFTAANQEARLVREEELAKFSASLTKATASVQEAMAIWYEESERLLEPMAIEIAEKILHAQLTVDRSVVVDTVKAAMQQVTHATEARVRVNPFDSELMRTLKQEILQAAPTVRNLEISEDPSIDAGCIIETLGGLVDARISSQLTVLQDSYGKAA